MKNKGYIEELQKCKDSRKCIDEICRTNLDNRYGNYTPLFSKDFRSFHNSLKNQKDAAYLLTCLVSELCNRDNILLVSDAELVRISHLGIKKVKKLKRILLDNDLMVIHTMVARGRQAAAMINPKYITWGCNNIQRKKLQKRYDMIRTVYAHEQDQKQKKAKNKPKRKLKLVAVNGEKYKKNTRPF